jgi:methylisocitrate lyase
VIVARTDALQVTGLDDAIARCNAYADAGADLVFVDAPPTREAFARIAAETTAPALANMSETGRSPTFSTDELEQLGYRVVIFPSTQTWLFAQAYRELADAVVRDRSTAALADRFLSFDATNELLGLDEWNAR